MTASNSSRFREYDTRRRSRGRGGGRHRAGGGQYQPDALATPPPSSPRWKRGRTSYGWIFGEREHGHRHPRRTHLRRAGSYTVTVTASNSLGAVSDTLTVEILAPPTEEPAARAYLPLLQR
ncbi:MAG: PKD domain-containing protein [Caldilineaceae bacterium]